MIKSVDLTPSPDLRSQLDDAYTRVISSGVYIGGLEVEAFEKEWSAYNLQPYCVAVGNGFDALQLLLRTMNVIGNSVYVPAITAPPTWSAVSSLGAIPTPFSVVETFVVPDRQMLLPAIFVNLYGQQCEIAPKFINAIEDCCQSHGLMPRLTAAWSFYPTKCLGCYGDSGAITTTDESLATHLRSLHNYGCRGAINSRMDPLQAAFLRVKLPYLNEWNEQRKEQAWYYEKDLQGLPITLPLPDISIPSVFHQYAIRTSSRKIRDALKFHLLENGIQSQIHYPIPPHRLLGYTSRDLPEADLWSATTLSLPIGPHLDLEDIHAVSCSVQRFFTLTKEV